MTQDDVPRPITEHLAELRRRLLWSVGAWGLCFAVAFSFKERVYEILMGPAVTAVRGLDRTLTVIAPAELFLSYLKASLLAGFMVAIPVTLYQGWAFVAPGLYSHEKRLALPFVLATTTLFVLGNLFGYFVAFPLIFDFFLSLESPYVVTQWTTQAVFSFLSRLYVVFGLSFQLPIVMFFLATAQIVTVEQMARSRPYAVIAIFVAAAVITPPDMVSQVMLAVPLMLLYEIGLLVSRISMRRRERQPSGAEA